VEVEQRQPASEPESARAALMTADYNGWNDAPEAEREAIDDYTWQEFEREGVAELAELQKSPLRLRNYVSESDDTDLTRAA
jgi:hypothetical protein